MSNQAEFHQHHTSFFMRKTSRLFLALAIITLLGTVFFSVSSAHKKSGGRQTGSLPSNERASTVSTVNLGKPSASSPRFSERVGTPKSFSLLLPQAPPSPDTVETFDVDCTTPKTAFLMGETVCAKVSGGPPLSLYPRKVAWVDNFNNIQQKADITTDPQTDLFTLPVAGPTPLVDYRGEWRVNSISAARSSVRASGFFSVSNPILPAADLSIYNSNDSNGSITAGSNIAYVLWISNKGPDPASNVQVTNATPANTTFVSGNTDDPNLNCTFPAANSTGGTTTCTLTTLGPGASTKLTLVYNVTSGTAPDTTISNTGNVSSATADPHDSSNTPPPNDPSADPSNNTATSRTTVVAGAAGATCTLQCPDNITAFANTTEGSQRGAHVTYDPAIASGDCGLVTASPASGSFFPVGANVVNVTSATGDGVCSFTVTVVDNGNNPPTISCPADPPAANANGDCEAAVAVGTPTTTGDNVSLFATRSDGKPMYDCDANGNCTRRASDAPFSAGITTITWTAYSHDAAGPWTTPATCAAGDNPEECHRTGSASCTEAITVNDVTPPVITATDSTVSADANCQAAVPDYSNAVTDNCSCAADDNSQDCVNRHRISVTQDPAAGTLVGLGPHTIHLTANDGSSNNNGAGNTTTKDITFTVNDTTPPVITCPANITTSNDPGTCSATVNPGTATATDNCDTTPTITGTRSDNQSLSAPYPKGTTTITWTATDDANNSSSCTQTVTVNDTEAPMISCPANITKDNDPGVCGAVVTYTTPVGSDNCSGATTAQTAGLPSGSTFPVGTTTNTFEVTDSSGNKTSCSFTVTVNDVESPVISCPSSQTLEPTCPSGAIANWTPPVGTDNCPGAVTTRTAGPAPGSVFPIGTTTVTYTVNDAHGHSASCGFTVTVKTVNQTIEDLKTSINNSSLSPTNKGGLLSKLQAAQDALAIGHTSTACSKLDAFNNSVQNLIDHGNISASQGQSWINSSNHVRNTIGCTNNPCT